MFRQGNAALLHRIVVNVFHLLVKHGRVVQLDGLVRLLPEHVGLVLVGTGSGFPK